MGLVQIEEAPGGSMPVGAIEERHLLDFTCAQDQCPAQGASVTCIATNDYRNSWTLVWRQRDQCLGLDQCLGPDSFSVRMVLPEITVICILVVTLL